MLGTSWYLKWIYEALKGPKSKIEYFKILDHIYFVSETYIISKIWAQSKYSMQTVHASSLNIVSKLASDLNYSEFDFCGRIRLPLAVPHSLIV